MDYIRINYVESIRRGRIVFRESIFRKVVDSIQALIFIVFPIVYGTIYFINVYHYPIYSNEYHLGLFYLIFTWSIGLFFLFRSSRLYKLKKFTGISEKVNVTIVHNIIKDLEWVILTQDDNFIIAADSKETPKAPKQMSILFDHNLVYLNIITKLSGGLKSPFHFMSDGISYADFREKWEELNSTAPNSAYKQ